LVRWLIEPARLSKEQNRALDSADRRGEALAVSAVTLMELAVLFGAGSTRGRVPARELLATLGASDELRIVPLDIEVATEVAALGDALRDPVDRTIVATARVHRLTLVTSDQRIIESKLVPVID
jgi:PIN domain nuclease of toxin-antitoxin system